MNIISRKEAKKKGLAHYFTGKPCKHGHISKRRVSNSTCFECHLKTNKNWREANPRYMGEWYLDNKEYALAKRGERYLEKRDEILARCKQYRDSNRDKVSASWLRWSKENPEAFRKIQRRYERKADAKVAKFIRRSVHRALAGAHKNGSSCDILGYTAKDLFQHLEKQFKKGMNWDNYGSFWHVDHIIPVSKFIKDGENNPRIINTLSNLRPEYARDNMKKGAKIESLL